MNVGHVWRKNQSSDIGDCWIQSLDCHQRWAYTVVASGLSGSASGQLDPLGPGRCLALDKYHLLIAWKIWLKSDEISLFWILLLALKIWQKMRSTISFSSSGKIAQKGTETWIGMSNLFLFCSYFPLLENVIRIELICSAYGTSTLLLWFSSHFPQY